MKQMMLVDLETQSFPVESGIYEVACLAVEDYRIVGELYLGKEIESYSGRRTYGFGFHDISRDKEYIDEFNAFLKQYRYPIVAHNCPFDKKFLLYYGWVAENYPFYCSMQAIRREITGLGSYSMASLMHHYGFGTTTHEAMSDVKNLLALLDTVRPQCWLPVKYRRRWTAHIKPRPLEEIDLHIDTTEMLTSEKVCFTGVSKFPRNVMQEIAIKNGAMISSTVTLSTTILVVGIDPGKKLDKAMDYGINVVSDEEFLEMLDLGDFAVNT